MSCLEAPEAEAHAWPKTPHSRTHTAVERAMSGRTDAASVLSGNRQKLRSRRGGKEGRGGGGAARVSGRHQSEQVLFLVCVSERERVYL